MNIAIFPDSKLRVKSVSVSQVTEETRSLVAAMTERMDAEKGVGIAAPQCGIPHRIFVLRAPKLEVFINPTIEDLGEGMVASEEGCLSLPGVHLSVSRFAAVAVRSIDLGGQEKHTTCRGLMSFCAQHEHDHLDGILMIDRVNNVMKRQACWQMWEASHSKPHP